MTDIKFRITEQSKPLSSPNFLSLKKSLTFLMLFCLLIFSGCTSLSETKQKLFGGDETLDSTPQLNTVTVDPAVYKPEKFSYFFKDSKSGVYDFIKYTQEFVYCSFPDVKDADFVNLLKMKYDSSDIEVKVLFDLTSAFTNFETSPIPRIDSKYNSLFAYGLDVKVGTQNSKFCVNEKGVIWFSSNLDGFTEAHLFYNKQISDIYKEKFLSLFK